MDSKGLVIGVPGGGGFQTTHVRTMAQLRLRVASENLVSCCAFEEKLVLFGSSLFPQGNLDDTALATVALRDRYTPYQEHGRMQAIRRGFANQVIGRVNFLWRPIVLNGQLLQSLSLGQRTLDALDTAHGVILRLVKDLLALQNVQDLLLPVDIGLGMQQFGELLYGDIGLGALVLEQFRALRAGGLQSLDPGGRRIRHGEDRKVSIARRG